MARVKLSGMPDPAKEYMVNFPRLDGGLNTWEQPHRLKTNESPDMMNLWWRKGALCSRDGQSYVSDAQPGTGWSAYESLYYDRAFFHIGSTLYWADASDTETLTLNAMQENVPENRGTWFRYGDKLYYKNRGGYYAIGYAEGTVTCGAVEAYTPIILINADPTTAAGDEYQGENRLSGQKTVWYSTAEGVKDYHLPVQNVDSVDSVLVDEVELAEGTGYTVDMEKGIVTFSTEPTHHDPVQVNTVRITYTKENAAARDSIMDCAYGTVYGGDQNVCIVFGGCAAQPNAYFWCGNHAAMDPGYFPLEQYNLAGDAQDAITGFGKQQNMLVIFKERSIGRAAFGTTEMANGRVLLTMDYTAINSLIGCDLPGSIQLVENNLVFASRRNGVCIVRDSSASYENNILPISRKVDNGLLKLLREAETVSSHDDGKRYWVAGGGAVYCWDYTLSGYTDPVWFYLTNVHATAFLTAGETTMHLDGTGRVTAMRRNFKDYGGPIHKKYRFAAQDMSSYDRLKDILSVIFTVDSDTDTVIRVTYETDYETRTDLTPVRAASWRLHPRNLSYRALNIKKFATVARRKPGCHHVRHFTMELENNEIGTDMAVVSAQIFYRYQGRDR